MSAVEERQTEKRALDKGDENDDVVPTKEARIENGKTEVSRKIGERSLASCQVYTTLTHCQLSLKSEFSFDVFAGGAS